MLQSSSSLRGKFKFFVNFEWSELRLEFHPNSLYENLNQNFLTKINQ